MKLNGEFYSKKNTDYNEELRKCIEETCNYCIINTIADSEEKINKPIMMLGKIQSGKTRAFTGLIALAFDNEFDVVFVLTKNSKALVQQTVSRMKKEFKFAKNKILVSDIMKTGTKMSGFELEKKNIIIAKKEKRNIDMLIRFIEEHSINIHKNCLIIDDEADTTGIGFGKDRNTEEFTLRAVSSRVNKMRGTLDGCVFVEVTATPYALYLQPEFDECNDIEPIKPLKTILVPHGEDYIGGEYYFEKSKIENHPSTLLFEAMSRKECLLVSDQKRKGKKSRIEDRRSFKVEEILSDEDILYTFKKGIVNFIIGVITLRRLNNSEACYAFVIHTANQKKSHFSLEDAAETLLKQMKNRNEKTIVYIESLVLKGYENIKKSVEIHGFKMPMYEQIRGDFYSYIDNGYYSIDVVNADKDIENLLDDENGELVLRTPCSIFVGGQVLDRGVTIPNMIGFYYGRNPANMQQDTVLQHSRMYGYRKELLPVTRFYTTERIHSNMEKITEIDIALREDIAKGSHGNGMYFITHKEQDPIYGTGGIKACSPNKIKLSDIMYLKPYKRILPVGFTPVTKTMYKNINKKIERIINDQSLETVIKLELDKAIQLVGLVYETFEKDVDSNRFVEKEDFVNLLKYMLSNRSEVTFVIKKNKANKKVRSNGRWEDSPAQGQQELQTAYEYAENAPVIILLQENGADESWGYKEFWWPILVTSKSISQTMYASNVSIETIRVDK